MGQGGRGEDNGRLTLNTVTAFIQWQTQLVATNIVKPTLLSMCNGIRTSVLCVEKGSVGVVSSGGTFTPSLVRKLRLNSSQS